MAAAQPTALFYPASLAADELLRLTLGFEPAAFVSLDVVEFADEEGGSADRELAVPYLPGMDEIEVDEVQIRLQALSMPLTIDRYSVTATSGADDAGVVVDLGREGRLLELQLAYPQFPPKVAGQAKRFTLFGGKIESREDGVQEALVVVIRPAVRQGAGYAFGPPIMSDRNFPLDSPLFPPALAGLSVRDLNNGRMQLNVPGLRGQAWLIQLAFGQSPDKLEPVRFSTTVPFVKIDAAPTNLTVELGPDRTLLWNNPGALLPTAGVQDVSFAPLAGRRLSAKLKELGPEADALTLPLALRFRSETGGAVQLTSKTLVARYLVHPAGKGGQTVRLDGGWTSLKLNAPAGLRPSAAQADLNLRMLGRELNGGSPVPPLERLSRGYRVAAQRHVAVALDFVATAPSTRLASARAYISARGDSEIVLEIREDAAGAPGPLVAGPLVRQAEDAFVGWMEFQLPAPIDMGPADRKLWITMRSNQGELFWYADGDGVARISFDEGGAWGAPEPSLAAMGAPLAQLFHATMAPLAAPEIEVLLEETPLTANLIPELDRRGDSEFSTRIALPEAIGDFFATSSAAGQTSLTLRLFSRSVADLTVESMTFSYDPYTKAGG